MTTELIENEGVKERVNFETNAIVSLVGLLVGVGIYLLILHK